MRNADVCDGLWVGISVGVKCMYSANEVGDATIMVHVLFHSHASDAFRAHSSQLARLFSFFPACQTKVAGLLDPRLDIFFPLSLFSRVPKYFDSKAHYRVVPAIDDNGRLFLPSACIGSHTIPESCCRFRAMMKEPLPPKYPTLFGRRHICIYCSPRHAISR